MIAGRMRVRDEDRWRSCGGELPDRAARARDREIGGRQRGAEVVRRRDEHVVVPAHARTHRRVVALARDVQHRRAALAERVDGELVQRLRSRETAEDREHRCIGRQPEAGTRLRLLGTEVCLRGSAARRPGTCGRRDRGSRRRGRPRRANGAASRFASPRCASASVSAAGIPRSRAASTIGPAT